MSTTTPRVRLAIAALALPHAAALQDFLADSTAAGEDGIDGSFDRPEWTHAETVAVFERWSREEPRPGWVPCTTRLLFDGERIVGVSNLRHRLTPHLLSHGGSSTIACVPPIAGKGTPRVSCAPRQEPRGAWRSTGSS